MKSHRSETQMLRSNEHNPQHGSFQRTQISYKLTRYKVVVAQNGLIVPESSIVQSHCVASRLS